MNTDFDFQLIALPDRSKIVPLTAKAKRLIKKVGFLTENDGSVEIRRYKHELLDCEFRSTSELGRSGLTFQLIDKSAI